MNLKLRTTKAMPKKAAKKKAPKPAARKKGKKLPPDGSDPNALGFTGPGVEVKRIGSLTKKINDYLAIKDARCALTPKEVAAKKDVIVEMEKHADELRDPQSGNLMYQIDDKHYVVIEPAKVTIKLKDNKRAKKKKEATAEEQTAKEPEQQLAEDRADQQD